MSRSKTPYMEKRIRVSVRGFSYTGTVEQGWEIYDHMKKDVTKATVPVIVQNFVQELWMELKSKEE